MLYEVASRRQAHFSCCPSVSPTGRISSGPLARVHRVAFLEHRGDDVVAGAEQRDMCYTAVQLSNTAVLSNAVADTYKSVRCSVYNTVHHHDPRMLWPWHRY